MDVSRENIRFYTRDSYILLIAYVYMSTLFLGIALLKNNKWTEKNYVLAIIIYTIIIAFNLVLWYFSIKYNLCQRVRRRIIEQGEWFQVLDINDIRRTIQNNFQVIEVIESENANDSDMVDESNNTDLNKIKRCIICSKEYERIENNIKYIKLSCEHDFCEECISEWCNKKNTCPLCRSEIINEKHVEV